MTPGNALCLAAIRVRKEGRPDWRWGGRDFRRIARKSRTSRWQLKGSSFWALIAAKDSSILAHYSHSDSGLEMTPTNILPQAAIMSRKAGRPERRRIGRDFRTIVRKSRTSHRQLTGSSFRTLISAPDASIMAHF